MEGKEQKAQGIPRLLQTPTTANTTHVFPDPTDAPGVARSSADPVAWNGDVHSAAVMERFQTVNGHHGDHLARAHGVAAMTCVTVTVAIGHRWP